MENLDSYINYSNNSNNEKSLIRYLENESVFFKDYRSFFTTNDKNDTFSLSIYFKNDAEIVNIVYKDECYYINIQVLLSNNTITVVESKKNQEDFEIHFNEDKKSITLNHVKNLILLNKPSFKIIDNITDIIRESLGKQESKKYSKSTQHDGTKSSCCLLI